MAFTLVIPDASLLGHEWQELAELRRSPLRVFHKGRSIKRRNAFARLLTPTTIHIQIFAK